MDNLESRVDALERAIGVPDTAEADRIQRDREQQAAEQVKRTKELKIELRAHCANYIEDVRQAEVAVRALAAAIGRLLEHAKSIARVSHAISGKAAPIVIGVTELARRLACRIAAVMSTVPDHRNRLGYLDWMAGHYKADDDWVAREGALIETHVQPLTD